MSSHAAWSLFVLVAVFAGVYYYWLYQGRMKPRAGTYLGTSTHEHSVLTVIETIAERKVVELPTLSDAEIVKHVSYELKAQHMPNVDLYEAAIFAIVRRLRGTAAEPRSGK